jgi:hypothetical protein
MLRHPVQLTSLEEDFKRLGLLTEEGEETMTHSGAGTPAPQMRPGPSGKPAPNKNGSRNVGAQSDGDSDAGEDGNDTVPGHEGADVQGNPTGKGAVKPSIPTVPGAQKESIVGGDSRRQTLRGEAKKKDDDDDDDEDDDDDDDDDKDDDKEESVELEGSSAVHESIRRLRGDKTEARTSAATPLKESKHASRLDKVASMIEDVNNIMESIDNTHKEDAVRAFANASIISEMLSKGFEHFASEYDDQDFLSTAQAFQTMSEDAANIAHALEEGEEIDPEALQHEFHAQMDGLMEGLDLYSDVVEADAEVDAEEGLSEDEEAEEVEEDTDGEQEEDTDGEQEEDSEGDQKEATFSAIRKLGSKFKKPQGLQVQAPGTQVRRESRDDNRRPTGGIVSQRTEGSFRYGKGSSGKKTAEMKK